MNIVAFDIFPPHKGSIGDTALLGHFDTTLLGLFVNTRSACFSLACSSYIPALIRSLKLKSEISFHDNDVKEYSSVSPVLISEADGSGYLLIDSGFFAKLRPFPSPRKFSCMIVLFQWYSHYLCMFVVCT